MTFDEWYDDPATQDALPVKARDVTRAAYEAGARSRDEEVERLRAALDTAAQLLDANWLFIHATIVCAALKKETEAARRAGKGGGTK